MTPMTPLGLTCTFHSPNQSCLRWNSSSNAWPMVSSRWTTSSCSYRTPRSCRPNPDPDPNPNPNHSYRTPSSCRCGVGLTASVMSLCDGFLTAPVMSTQALSLYIMTLRCIKPNSALNGFMIIYVVDADHWLRSCKAEL